MAEHSTLDNIYHLTLQRFIDTGSAPHYTEIAAELAMSTEDARQSLHELMSAGVGGLWIHPGTDHIVGFGPFSNLPTQIRITIEGEQKWFAE